MPKKGYKQKEEHKRKNSEAHKGQISWNKGKHLSKQHKKKLSESHRGQRTNLGKHWKIEDTSKMKGHIISEETRRKMSIEKTGHDVSDKTRKKLSGKNHWNWKGGISSEIERIRHSIDSKNWRKAVFERNDFTCRKCNQRGGKLHPHHINNFADYPELRFAIDNGITFCRDCHRRFHKKYGIKNNTQGQLEEFLELDTTKKEEDLTGV